MTRAFAALEVTLTFAPPLIQDRDMGHSLFATGNYV